MSIISLIMSYYAKGKIEMRYMVKYYIKIILLIISGRPKN